MLSLSVSDMTFCGIHAIIKRFGNGKHIAVTKKFPIGKLCIGAKFQCLLFYWVLHMALSNAFSWTEYFVLKYIFRNLFPQSQSKLDLNSSNINTKQLTNHYLNQWWQSYLSHTCIDVLCCIEWLSCREIKRWLEFSASLPVFSINRTFTLGKRPGPRLNIKTVLSTYGDFHVKDKTVVRTSYL